jgi:hypothetical protein
VGLVVVATELMEECGRLTEVLTFLHFNWACLLGEVGLFLGRLSIFRSRVTVNRAGVFEGRIVQEPFEFVAAVVEASCRKLKKLMAAHALWSADFRSNATVLNLRISGLC